MKNIFFLISLAFCFIDAQAQNLDWAKTINNHYNDYIFDMKVDKDGSMIICGNVGDSIDFDPGPGVAWHWPAGGAGADIFVAKYDVSGNYLWSHSFGTGFYTDEGDRVATDTAGNVFLTGFFGSTVDFDPDTLASFTITANPSSRSRFLAKYDKDGYFIAAKNVGKAVGNLPSSQDGQSGLECDFFGNVYMSGFYGTTLTLDAVPGGTLSVSGLSDNYFCKYDDSLNLIWANRIGGSGTEYSQGLYVSDSGTVITMGSFSNTVDFDPDTSNVYLTQTGNTIDGYFAEFDSGGHFVFVKHLIPVSGCSPRAVTIDKQKNILVTGSAMGMMDADPDTGVVIIGDGYNDQVFLCKYDSAGNYKWAFAYGDINAFQTGYAVATDSADNIYLSGFYQPFVDLNPSIDTATLGNVYSGFVALYDTAGNFRTAINSQFSQAKMYLHNEALYLAGGYYGLVDFDPGPAVYNMLSDTLNASWYLLKMNLCNTFPATPGTIQLPAICAGDTITVLVNQGGPNYAWTFGAGLTPIGNTTSASVQLAVDTAALSALITCQSIGGCINSAIVYTTVTVNHAITPIIIQVGDSLFTTSTAIAYQWYLNGTLVSGTDSIYSPLASGIYTVMITDSNGCSALSAPFNYVIIGIENMDNQVVSVNPNPFQNELTISINNHQPVEVIIYDLTSRIILQQTFTNSTTLNTQNLANGMYLYEVRNKNGVIEKGKVIKD